MADTTVQNEDYFLCSCYFSRNIFLQKYELHVSFTSPDQFRKEYREVRYRYCCSFRVFLCMCNRACVVGIFRYAATLNALDWAALPYHYWVRSYLCNKQACYYSTVYCILQICLPHHKVLYSPMDNAYAILVYRYPGLLPTLLARYEKA